ncbi:MAG: penicillin-binding protein 2 [Candidatus Paceibacterota bacterium]|jgi:cell division protein FtsI/penicillin-binding protein 2
MSKNWRINIVLFFIFLGAGMVITRLFYLQIQQGNFYKAMGQGQQTSLLDAKGERGNIYFSNGEPLALTERAAYVFISPTEITEKEKVVEELSKILNIDTTEILEKANVPNSQYQIIQKNLSKSTAENIENLQLEGIHIGYEQQRDYPNKQTACQLVGYVNQEGQGQYGVEEYYNNELEGKESVQKNNTNPWNFLLSPETNDSINGASIYLTIDYNIQYVAEKLLADKAEDYGYKSGSIIVMEPDTGAIIAMAQYPLFDPNSYQTQKDFSIFQNDAVQRIFEPGSIFKSITMAAALNEKKVTPGTTYNDNKGYEQFGTYKVSNYNDHIWGLINMTNVLEHSINTGIMFAEQQIGHSKFIEYLENFGFFEKSGIDLSGEVASQNQEIKKALANKNSAVTFGNASFGQGIGINPLHITTAYCAIANGGNLVKPYIVKEIDTNTKKITQTQTVRRVLTAETTDALKNMMTSVVENGYGHLAKIPGYYIAGKTGTAQAPWTSLGINKGGYSDQTWQTFLGFAPAYNPKFVALVKLDNPANIKTSEYSATPIFHDLAKYIFDYWQIPPDYIEQTTETIDTPAE